MNYWGTCRKLGKEIHRYWDCVLICFLLIGIYNQNRFCIVIFAASNSLISQHLSYQVCLADVSAVRCLSLRRNTVDHSPDLQTIILSYIAFTLISLLCGFCLALNSLVDIFVALGTALSYITLQDIICLLKSLVLILGYKQLSVDWCWYSHSSVFPF